MVKVLSKICSARERVPHSANFAWNMSAMKEHEVKLKPTSFSTDLHDGLQVGTATFFYGLECHACKGGITYECINQR